MLTGVCYSLFSLGHLCGTDGPVYTSLADKGTGFAGDRFWFDGANNFCMSTATRGPSGWWSHGDKCVGTGVRQIWLNVEFSADQIGCEPKKTWNVPKTQECIDIFSRLLDGCELCFFSSGRREKIKLTWMQVIRKQQIRKMAASSSSMGRTAVWIGVCGPNQHR